MTLLFPFCINYYLFLFCISSIGISGLVTVSALLAIVLSTLVAVGRDGDVTVGSGTGSSDSRTPRADIVMTSGGFLLGAVAFPFPT